ncbi:MAG: hypothetical protein ACT4OX_05440 [Actinomycetota bacterium]
MRGERAFVSIELVAATALVFLPVVVLVGTLPVWVERKHTATLAAREAVAAVVRDPATDAVQVAQQVAANHGVDADQLDIHVSGGTAAGEYVTVAVGIEMPAIAVGPWTYTAVQHRRIDDYGSR